MAFRIMVYVHMRLQASLEASSIKKAIEEAFVQLGYQKPTSSQEYAITEFVLEARRVCVLTNR